MMYGNKLKNLRERNGLTQEELGKHINVTKQAFHHFEKEYTIIPENCFSFDKVTKL